MVDMFVCRAHEEVERKRQEALAAKAADHGTIGHRPRAAIPATRSPTMPAPSFRPLPPPSPGAD
ncbi:hypothetical protein OC835_004587 [Tilletia horrida]|nr:hypothetical protein OC835_004587 [Tilletia horrida]